MSGNKKNIVVFFRGSDASNRVASSSKSHTDAFPLPGVLNIEYVNLDKRDIAKYLAKRDTPVHIVYLWHDEEKSIDLLAEKYPDIEVRPYSNKTDVNYTEGQWGGKRNYLLGDKLIKETLESLGTVEKFEVVKEYHGFRVSPVKFSTYEFSKLNHRRLQNMKNTQEEAEAEILVLIDKRIADIGDEIKYAEHTIANGKEELVSLRRQRLGMEKKIAKKSSVKE